MDKQTFRIWLLSGCAALIGVLLNYLEWSPFILIPVAIWLGFFALFWMFFGDMSDFVRIHSKEARNLIRAFLSGNSNLPQSMAWVRLANTWPNVLSSMFAGWAICAVLWDSDPHGAFIGFGVCVGVVIVIKWIALAYLKARV